MGKVVVGIRRVRELLTRFCRKAAARDRRRILEGCFEAARIPKRLLGSGRVFLGLYPSTSRSVRIPTRLRSGLGLLVSRVTRGRRRFFHPGGSGGD